MEDLFRQGADKEAARSFADKWASRLSGIPDGSGEKQYCQEFWIDLIEAFGKPRDLLDFEHRTAGNGYADVISGELGFIAEQKSKNVPLDKPEPRHGRGSHPISAGFQIPRGPHIRLLHPHHSRIQLRGFLVLRPYDRRRP